MKTKSYFTLLLLLFSACIARAQQGQNEFEKRRVYCELDGKKSVELIKALKTSDNSSFEKLKEIFNPRASFLSGADQSVPLSPIISTVSEMLNAVDSSKNVAVILVYRTITQNDTAKNIEFDIDYSSLNTKIFHKQRRDTTFSSYLLATKKVIFIFLDVSNAHYLNDDAGNVDKKLYGTVLNINYRTSFFKQSFKDLSAVWGAMGGTPAEKLGVTIVEVNPSRVKDPCDLVLSNKSFKNDETFTIHERNYASFQVGVSNSKLAVNNISISGGNLVVKPDADQATAWKSNAYALLELHVPRDIDNFRPLWQSIFSKQAGQGSRNAGQWFMDNLITRLGVYGGVKIAKDPISNLYAGLSFAVTKEFGFNFGYTWINDYATQVTDIGSITSVDDALKYAKRRYSPGKFSIGISFSPSAFSTAVGLKSSSADSGN